MICPFCGEDMKKGTLSGDGRSKVRWFTDSEKARLGDIITGKGTVTAKYTLTKFEIESYYCQKCKKMIFDTEVSK